MQVAKLQWKADGYFGREFEMTGLFINLMMFADSILKCGVGVYGCGGVVMW